MFNACRELTNVLQEGRRRDSELTEDFSLRDASHEHSMLILDTRGPRLFFEKMPNHPRYVTISLGLLGINFLCSFLFSLYILGVQTSSIRFFAIFVFSFTKIN